MEAGLFTFWAMGSQVAPVYLVLTLFTVLVWHSEQQESPLTIAIAAPSNRSARLRALAERHPYMTPLDIAKLTGEPLRLVQLALTRDDDNAKGKALTVEAKGPLSAAQVAHRTRMPIDVAKLFVR